MYYRRDGRRFYVRACLVLLPCLLIALGLSSHESKNITDNPIVFLRSANPDRIRSRIDELTKISSSPILRAIGAHNWSIEEIPSVFTKVLVYKEALVDEILPEDSALYKALFESTSQSLYLLDFRISRFLQWLLILAIIIYAILGFNDGMIPFPSISDEPYPVPHNTFANPSAPPATGPTRCLAIPREINSQPAVSLVTPDQPGLEAVMPSAPTMIQSDQDIRPPESDPPHSIVQIKEVSAPISDLRVHHQSHSAQFAINSMRGHQSRSSDRQGHASEKSERSSERSDPLDGRTRAEACVPLDQKNAEREKLSSNRAKNGKADDVKPTSGFGSSTRDIGVSRQNHRTYSRVDCTPPSLADKNASDIGDIIRILAGSSRTRKRSISSMPDLTAQKHLTVRHLEPSRTSDHLTPIERTSRRNSEKSVDGPTTTSDCKQFVSSGARSVDGGARLVNSGLRSVNSVARSVNSGPRLVDGGATWRRSMEALVRSSRHRQAAEL